MTLVWPHCTRHTTLEQVAQSLDAVAAMSWQPQLDMSGKAGNKYWTYAGSGPRSNLCGADLRLVQPMPSQYEIHNCCLRICSTRWGRGATAIGLRDARGCLLLSINQRTRFAIEIDKTSRIWRDAQGFCFAGRDSASTNSKSHEYSARYGANQQS